MKDWEDIIKERQLSRKAELPESDWNDFLSRKASHDFALKRRRRFITAAISVPAAAAVLLLLFLMPFKSDPQGAMEETAVQGVVAKVQAVSDTAKFNMAAYRLPEGESVEDLIRKLPGVQIDSTGNVTVNGKSISRILVNGKEFFAGDSTKNLIQLTAEMIEKVKAYEKNSDLSRQTGIDDGREQTVLDLDVRKVRRGDGRIRRHRYVDMGLSVKWATCNVGADKPEDLGNYYAWGETETKSEYLLSNYRFSKWFISDETNDSTMLLTKYCNNAGYGYDGLVDNKTVLDPEDDVAHVKWGGDWRIPTIEEWNELKENCTWTWGNMNGVYGFYVTSNMPGYTDHTIFLPAAGLSAHTVTGVGSYIDYVLSSLNPYSDQFECYSASFTKARFVPHGYVFRYLGLSVRPVCK
ncbi:MAG: hypothetical protein J6V95_00560 [Bacteroidaceae bacterium]|nr:hypothetical protein [Bacteroidaceae bacterium]